MFMMGLGGPTVSFLSNFYIVLIFILFGIEISGTTNPAPAFVLSLAASGAQLIMIFGVACHFVLSPKNIASKFSYRWSIMTTMITFMEAFLRTAKHPAAKIFTYTIMGVPVISAANFIITLMIYLGDLYYMIRTTGQGKEKYVQARGPGGGGGADGMQ